MSKILIKNLGPIEFFDQDVNAVVIRKDVLDEFLAKTNMKLIWTMDAEKEVDRQSQDMVNWSEWEGVFVCEGDFVSGEFALTSQNE